MQPPATSQQFRMRGRATDGGSTSRSSIEATRSAQATVRTHRNEGEVPRPSTSPLALAAPGLAAATATVRSTPARADEPSFAGAPASGHFGRPFHAPGRQRLSVPTDRLASRPLSPRHQPQPPSLAEIPRAQRMTASRSAASCTGAVPSRYGMLRAATQVPSGPSTGAATARMPGANSPASVA